MSMILAHSTSLTENYRSRLGWTIEGLDRYGSLSYIRKGKSGNLECLEGWFREVGNISKRIWVLLAHVVPRVAPKRDAVGRVHEDRRLLIVFDHSFHRRLPTIETADLELRDGGARVRICDLHDSVDQIGSF
jgi:hypothetical protein